MVKKIKEILSSDMVQRTIYSLGLILWTIISWEMISGSNKFVTSSLGINYLTVYLLPASVLSLQVLRNNKLLWSLILGVIIIYILISLFRVMGEIVERSINPIKPLSGGLADFGFLLIFFGLLSVISWTIFQMRPIRLI